MESVGAKVTILNFYIENEVILSIAFISTILYVCVSVIMPFAYDIDLLYIILKQLFDQFIYSKIFILTRLYVRQS